MRSVTIALLAAALALPAAAQQQQQPDSNAIKLKQRVDAIFGIPQRADDARQAGVPDTVIANIMKIFGKERIPAQDAGTILAAERDAARETDAGGPKKDNLGAYVQQLHAQGLRGRELADAIHAEQARRKMGRPGGAGAAKGKAPDAGMGKGKAPDAAMGKGKAGGPAEAKGQQGKGKRPDSTAAKGPRRPL